MVLCYQRAFELNRHLKRIHSSLDELDEFLSEFKEGTETVSQDKRYTARRAVQDLMESTEVVQYVFPELGYEHWFGSFLQDVEHTYWRIEDDI
jgi:exonuclease VII small subunit